MWNEKSKHRTTTVNINFSKNVQRIFTYNKTVAVTTLTLVIEGFLEISKLYSKTKIFKFLKFWITWGSQRKADALENSVRNMFILRYEIYWGWMSFSFWLLALWKHQKGNFSKNEKIIQKLTLVIKTTKLKIFATFSNKKRIISIKLKSS